MKIDIKKYIDNYYQGEKMVDNWQRGIKLLPFNSNPSSSGYDKKCGLQGITGEFFRLWENDGSQPIEDFKSSIEEPLKEYLNDKRMPSAQLEEYVRMIKDILYVDGNLNISDSSFLKYLPLIPDDESISDRDKKKYKDGQKKLANYLFSMLSPGIEKRNHTNRNLFIKILSEALTNFSSNTLERTIYDYKVLPYINSSFAEDLKWLMEQDESVKVKYIRLLLYFYVCYSITQTITCLNSKNKEENRGPVPFYFILNSERASVNHDAVTRGWTFQIPKSTLDKLYGKSQALDILNCILGGDIGFYDDIYAHLLETPFEENREACNTLLTLYQEDKKSLLSKRKSEEDTSDEIVISVNSYHEFLETLEHLCMNLQSKSYIPRMRKKIIDLLSVRFLQSRRGNFVLALDNEMLTFLIALFTKSKKTKLEDMYKKFNSYGIYFNRGTRLAIEDYLLKLNLLDRKSDSGETQYVRVIL